MSHVGKLSIVATPIGNLEDITLRALRVLKEADVVACEDTRVTKKLLSHFDIAKQTISFHAHSGVTKFEKIIDLLEDGKHVALVTDAGTPGLSDPGLELVSVVRDRFLKQTAEKKSGQLAPRTFFRQSVLEAEALPIEPIPGPSALAAAVSVAGLRVPSFTFYGFLPQKKGRETLLKEIVASDRASIFYESPHRIIKTLEALTKSDFPKLGKSDLVTTPRRVGVFRELTKLHEEHVVGSASEVLDYFVKNPDRIRGEFVVIVEARN